MSGTRDECVFMARLAEQAERYEDMVEYMKRVATIGVELQLEERNLLSVAYKNAVGARRQAWRMIEREVRNLAGRPEAAETCNLIRGYQTKVEAELNGKCQEALDTIASLLPTASTGEAKVFYLKMKGDYYRYLAEFASAEAHQKSAQDAKEAYTAAKEIADAELPPTNPIRLGLALNFSVFYFEVLRSPEQACSLAKESFDSAIAQVEQLNEEQYKDSSTILQLLRDNLNLWTADIAAANGGAPPAPDDGTAVEDF